MAKGLNFGLLGKEDNLQTADYRSAGSHQAENLQVELVTDINVWEEIYTVPADKTYYISALMISTIEDPGRIYEIGIGPGAGEVAVLQAVLRDTTPLFLAFPTPMKFTGGTRISVRSQTASDCFFTFVGWEE